ncbi:MAG TPA: hypothetical protein VKB29_11070, partial [Candidatus Binataceae bacterium]|nr:hypothetical protein [Candidatus Binataceae bacterium]
ELADDIAKGNGTGAVLTQLVRHRKQTRDAVVRVAEFARQIPPQVKLAVAPELAMEAMHDLGGLHRIAGFITSGIDIGEILGNAVLGGSVTRRSRRAVQR